MKRTLRWIALIAVVMAAGALVGCAPGGGSEPTAGTTPARVTEADDGQTVELTKGQDLLVELQANPSTGYTWVVTAMPSIVETVGEPQFVSDAGSSGVVGAGGTMTYTFRAVSTGNGKLELGYKRPWETDTAPEQTYSLDITAK